VTLDDGSVVVPDDLVGPIQRGRSVAYCSDTSYCSAAVELARGCDVLIHEATFASSDVDVAEASAHSTAADAARVACEARVGRLVLTHISGRYATGTPIDVPHLLNEAAQIFPDTIVAEDLMVLDVDRGAVDSDAMHNKRGD
jgi:ribonuclease Z